MSAILVEARGVAKYFDLRRGVLPGRRAVLRAVDGVSLGIAKGETLGLVGESGCGKTTLVKTLLKLYQPTRGTVLFEGQDISRLDRDQMQRFRRKVQMVFQNPFAAFNPRMTVSDLIAEPLDIHCLATGGARRERIHQLLENVGLPSGCATRFPHQFSGGQRQRIGIARALALEPECLVLDEPVAALDVSTRAQLMNILADLRISLGLTCLLIAHDLSLVRHLCDRVAVMYLGKIVELAPNKHLYNQPLHPYTRALLAAVPVPDVRTAGAYRRVMLDGEVPSPINPPGGCGFHTRCALVMAGCQEQEPGLRDMGGGHQVACHLV